MGHNGITLIRDVAKTDSFQSKKGEMMLKPALGLVFVCVMILVGSVIHVSGDATDQEMCVPMGTIMIKPPQGVDAKRSPVPFPHSKHFATACQECHHKWNGTEKIQSCQTSGCHDQAAPPAQKTRYLSYSNEVIRYFKYAYHQACIGCHQDIKEQNRKLEMSYQVIDEKLPEAGPSGCVECHGPE